MPITYIFQKVRTFLASTWHKLLWLCYKRENRMLSIKIRFTPHTRARARTIYNDDRVLLENALSRHFTVAIIATYTKWKCVSNFYVAIYIMRIIDAMESRLDGPTNRTANRSIPMMFNYLRWKIWGKKKLIWVSVVNDANSSVKNYVNAFLYLPS